MNFKELLLRAKAGDQCAVNQILQMYTALLFKESVVDGVFDADLHQELCMLLLHCIQKFKA